MMDENKPPYLGTIIYEDHCRAEIRVAGVNRLCFMAQFPPHHWDWVQLREISTLKEARDLCKALGYRSLQ